MSIDRPDVCRVLVPSGALGSGCPEAAFQRGLSLRPDALAVDAGSTDSGPHYLGAGISKMTRKATKRDLRQLMLGRAALGVPLIVGSCGTSGTDSGVDWMADICAEIAREEGLTVKVALIYSEQSADRLAQHLAAGAVTPLPPAAELTIETIAACDHIVALMGYEPLAAAIREGADIVLAGRTTDTAVIAAVPVMRGFPPAAAWHAAKISECGGLCTTHTRQGGVMLFIDADGFEVEPLHAENSCTPFTVSAHMLYENSDPFTLKEPGVKLDVEGAEYAAVDARRVRVTGSRFEATPYTMKLEGSGGVGYRTMVFSAIADRKVLKAFDAWLEGLKARLHAGVTGVLGYAAGDYDLQFRAYGRDALKPSGAPGLDQVPSEVGLMTLVRAKTQAEATEIAKFCNPTLLHFPLNPEDPMPSFAFPFSPAEVELGRFYEFKLNHVVAIDDPLALCRTEWLELQPGGQDGAA